VSPLISFVSAVLQHTDLLYHKKELPHKNFSAKSKLRQRASVEISPPAPAAAALFFLLIQLI